MLNSSVIEKLKILADAAKYDVSCASSGVNRKNGGGLGNATPFGICHTWSSDGRCVSLLKILLTNDCIFDCTYCINRVTNDVKRASFSAEEVASLTIEFYRRNYIEGLFLSSAIENNPNYTMEKIIRCLLILRNKENFNGYIHVKAIPGADPILIEQAGKLADRMSVNIELPSEESLNLLAPQKKPNKLYLPMAQINQGIIMAKEERRRYKYSQKFVPAGQSTQMIIGATNDSDRTILMSAENLYKTFNMKRVYYSAYIPVNKESLLPSLNTSPPLLREHRLYQADWLLRFYRFEAKELLNETENNFDLEFDPKMNWALNNLEKFPVEINKDDYNTLLRVPGIGIKSAMKIIRQRTIINVKYEDLKKFGVVIKRARFFITCNGKYFGERKLEPDIIKKILNPKPQFVQQSIFS